MNTTGCYFEIISNSPRTKPPSFEAILKKTPSFEQFSAEHMESVLRYFAQFDYLYKAFPSLAKKGFRQHVNLLVLEGLVRSTLLLFLTNSEQRKRVGIN